MAAMDSATGRIFLDYSARKLEQLSGRIVTCLGRLNQDQVWRRGAETENAVANIVLHLCGNLRQWIGFGVDGRPDVRERDREFAARKGAGPAALAALLEDGAADSCLVLRRLPEGRLLENVTVQGYTVTVLEAVYHVVEHFSYHAGQVVFATKNMTGEDPGFYRHLSQPGRHHERTP